MSKTQDRRPAERQRARTKPKKMIRDRGEWYVFELCELLENLVDLNAEIYGYDGPRDLLTVIIDAQKDPALMGFQLLGDEPALFPEAYRQQAEDIQIALEDVAIGKEIEDGVELQEGVQVPLEGKLVSRLHSRIWFW